MRPQRNTPDWRIAALGERQHGVVAHRQLLAAGLGVSAIQRRVRAGRLHRLHRGVYAVGHRRVTASGRWMAAVLAYGPGALLSHRSAAALWELMPSARSLIDVTVERQRRAVSGVAVHRTRRLRASDRARQDGIPVTSVMRTLADLADVARPDQLRRAVEEAEARGLFDLRALPDLRGRPGRGRLQRLVADYTVPPPTRSELERRFLGLCREAGLPPPGVNVLVAGILVDAVWEAHRLVVELDGHTYHRTRAAFEEDRRRDTALQVAGYRVVRVTQRRLTEAPGAVLAAVRLLLDG
jgi:hypothetical protein